MGDPTAFLVLGLISMSQLWEGVHCNHFELIVAKDVSVQKGLCVAIPCKFTYSHSNSEFMNPDELYGYWHEVGNNPSWYPAFATNDERKDIVPGARDRFRLSEQLEEGDCSLFITDAQESDNKTYYFRIVKGRGRHIFQNRISVIVTEMPEPEIQVGGKLRAGEPVDLSCTAASCPWKSPQISWEFVRNITGNLNSSSNGTITSSLVHKFVPLAAENDQDLACKVTYGSGSANMTSEKTIHLNVSYPPQRLETYGELRGKNEVGKSLRGLSHTEAQEGDVIHLICVAKGNPSPNVTWVHRSQSKTRLVASSYRLSLDNLKKEDMGEYACLAQNSEGSSERTFQVYMPHNPKVCSQSNTSCWKEDDGFRCNCSICSFPGPKIQWVVDGETVDGNTPNKAMAVTSWSMPDKATSMLHLKGDWNGHRSVLCHGNSSTGEIAVNFLLFSSKAHCTTLSESIIVPSLLGLSLIKVVVCFLIFSCIIWFSNGRKLQRDQH